MMEVQNQNKSTRERVLETLLTNQNCTVNEIAESVGINPISVRHHIARLEADGFVSSTEERYGVGRPRRVYSLTEDGREQFPTSYLKLTIRLLRIIKDTLPQDVIDTLFSQIAHELIADYQDELNELTIEEKLDLITTVLSEEGFQVNWEKQDDHYLILESNCPYYHIGHNHPEVCSVDHTLISSVLSKPVDKVKCMLHGDNQCTYIIPS